MLAYLIWAAEICPNCGTKNNWWVDDTGRYLDEPTHEMVSHKCHGCEIRSRMQATIPDDSPGVYVLPQRRTPGLLMEIEQREVEMEARERADRLRQQLPEGGLFG